MLRRGIELRRQRLHALEARMVEGCEAAAHRGDPSGFAAGDRLQWDRGAQARYLQAATRLERCYGGRMRRLRDDIARLERLLDLVAGA